MVERQKNKLLANELSVNNIDMISDLSKLDITKILSLSQIVKCKVFFVRHGMTVEEGRRKRKKEDGEIVDGLLTQTAETRLGVEGGKQIIDAASKLKPFLGRKVIFIYPADGEEEGILGAHERINESLYLMLCEVYGIEMAEYNKSNLVCLIERLKEEKGKKIEFWKQEELNTTTKRMINGKRKVKSKADLTRKNLEVCASTAKFLSSDKIRNCEKNTQFVVLTHKAETRLGEQGKE